MKIAIIIPSRLNSSRFPAKSLHKISGIVMIERVARIALLAASSYSNVQVIIATDDSKIKDAVNFLPNIKISMTGEAKTGSDRIYQVLKNEKLDVDYIINYQGDAPLTHPTIISKIIDQLINSNNNIEILTPYVQLSWEELNKMEQIKLALKSSSGTMIIKDKNDYAIWFSKNIIPNIRKPDRTEKYSPILKHIGIYAYRRDILEKFVSWPESYYEKIEELEQLRFLENGYKIKLLDITNIGYPVGSGVDKIEDIAEAENFIEKYGEFFV